MSGSFEGVKIQISGRVNSLLKHRGIPGLKLETWGTHAVLMNHDEQHKPDAEDDQRNKEMAVGKNGFGLFERCHLRGASFQSAGANITGEGAALSRSARRSCGRETCRTLLDKLFAPRKEAARIVCRPPSKR